MARTDCVCSGAQRAPCTGKFNRRRALVHLTRPDVSLRGRFAPVAISGRHFQFVQGADKTYRPIASVAALIERHADWQLLRYAFCGVKLSDLSLRGGQRPTWRPERAARGSALGVQSRSARLNHWKAFGENANRFTGTVSVKMYLTFLARVDIIKMWKP